MSLSQYVKWWKHMLTRLIRAFGISSGPVKQNIVSTHIPWGISSCNTHVGCDIGALSFQLPPLPVWSKLSLQPLHVTCYHKIHIIGNNKSLCIEIYCSGPNAFILYSIIGRDLYSNWLQQHQKLQLTKGNGHLLSIEATWSRKTKRHGRKSRIWFASKSAMIFALILVR